MAALDSEAPTPAEIPEAKLLLEVEEVSTGYVKGVPTIQRCSLNVGCGEIVGVLGSNNAGKTTLIRAVTGSLPIWEGSVRFDGNDISHTSPERAAKMGIGVALEGRRIFGSLTVEENLLLPVSSKKGEGKAGQKQLLEKIYEAMPDLWRHRNAWGSALSGGQQQMLAIGRALMVEPQLLILDEPSLGLSPRFTELVVELLQSINRQYRTAILVAEQLVWIANEVSARVYVMDSGCLGAPRRRGEWSEHDLSDAYLGTSTRRSVPT